MSGGNLPEYIEKNPNVDRPRLVCVPLVVYPMPAHITSYLTLLRASVTSTPATSSMGTSKEYVVVLISRVTTVLTPDQQNILVDNTGRVRIADFGLSTVARNLDSIPSTSCQHGFTPQWTAPEVLNGEKYSKEADVFSFAMVTIEVRHR